MAPRVSLSLLAGLLGLGCQSLSPGRDDPRDDEAPVGVEQAPIDSRPVQHSNKTPIPISGGTLLALSDGRAIAADPERDRIFVVDVAGLSFRTIELEAGAQPGRAVESKDKRAYVVLRGTGEVLTIDLTTNQVSERRRVCALPRGIALKPTADGLVVACAEGKLVDLPLAGSDGMSETATSQDARDVVFAKDKLFVSRFRSAELVELDANRAQKSVRRLPDVGDPLRFDQLAGGFAMGQFEPAVAWRTVAHPSGSGAVVMVHQRATVEDIDINPHADDQAPPVEESSYGGGAAARAFSSCGGIVHSAVTIVDGDRVTTSPQLGGSVLPVDVAVSKSGLIAVASAGGRDMNAPTNFSFQSGSSVRLLTLADVNRAQSGECLEGSFTTPVSDQAVAVAFTPTEQLLVQTREPAGIIIVNTAGQNFPSNGPTISFGGDARLDTGHEIFHRDAGGGIACASCHVEGTDDGRTWNFKPIGARRTQPVDVGLKGTEPFHWDGTLPTMDRLMNEVFVTRMGGPRESGARVDALSEWVFQLPARAPLRPATDASAQRGKALFDSAEVGCTSCHTGPKFTNNRTVDVGTGVALQVPSLLGVGQRLPLMHNGCAKTMMDRFDASCGGNAHGNTANLSHDQLVDLSAYLESI